MLSCRCCLGFLVASVVGLLSVASGIAVADDRRPLDRIMAVVDADPILASELDQVLSFGIVQPQEGQTERDLRRRALDFLIAQRLRFHEVDRFGFAEVPLDLVDEQFAQVRARFSSEEQFRQRLAELDLDEQDLRQILARQVMVWVYVEERLGARVFVGLEDIQTYYSEQLVPQLIERGEKIPPLQEVREAVRALLREQRMNEELERWTQELMERADVEDYFDSRYDSPPPLLHGGAQGAE